MAKECLDLGYCTQNSYLSSDKRLAKTHPADPAPTTIWLYSEDVEYLFGLILSLQKVCKPWNDKGCVEDSIPKKIITFSDVTKSLRKLLYCYKPDILALSAMFSVLKLCCD